MIMCTGKLTTKSSLPSTIQKLFAVLNIIWTNFNKVNLQEEVVINYFVRFQSVISI